MGTASTATMRPPEGREDEIRRLADALYLKADWQWMQNGAAAVSHGWTPEKGFLRYRWHGYDEALIQEFYRRRGRIRGEGR